MIFVTGDTHGLIDFQKLQTFAEENPNLKKDDYLIIAGDFGGLWSSDTADDYLSHYEALPFTTLFVDGNHENFDMINSYPVEIWQGGKVHKIKPDIIHLMRGQIFQIEGKSIFTFGGATSVDKAFRIEGESWWRQELPSSDELDEAIENLNRRFGRVDYVITHSASKSAIELPPIRYASTYKLHCPENMILSYIEGHLVCKRWYFGHFHTDANLNDKYTALYQKVVMLGD